MRLALVRPSSFELHNQTLKTTDDKSRDGLRKDTDRIDIGVVAKHARVSIATVSRVINNVRSVNSGLSARVWKAVEELDYFPNTQARALVSGKSKLLGLIVSEIANPFSAKLVQEFEREASVRGYETLISSTYNDSKAMALCARRMLDRSVDGVAIMTLGNEEFIVDRFVGARIPTVFINAKTRQPNSDELAVDYRSGIYEGVQHLAALGHRRIGFISGPLGLHSVELRQAAFLEAMCQIGIAINPAWIVEGNRTVDSGREAMRSILALREWPTALMCSNDLIAIGVQQTLFEDGLKVPHDFSLIGFDDELIAEYTIPPLTTIRVAWQEVARTTVTTLISRASAPERSSESRARVWIGTRLVVRQTTGPPKMSGLLMAQAYSDETSSGNSVKLD